ncbi:hypothetical protein [Fluoribacter gormanii]|uniref:hypothetical protein n=1 Tax=Fluoribacter gormanii TaxID=464 RepID=UPI00104143D8|nr:hypothetical protein [Fluoribacter gormanii]
MDINEHLPKGLQVGDWMAEISKYDESGLIYRKTYVAFIDILGYKSIMDKSGQDAPDNIYKPLFYALADLKSSKKHIKVTVFSDSIIIEGGDDHPTTFWSIAHDLMTFQFRLLQKKILVRGGVSFGDHFSKEGIVVSPALIEAYNLEQKANFPRIIISPSAYTSFTQNIQSDTHGKFVVYERYKVNVRDELISRDDDGHHVLSFIPSHVELDYLKYGIHPDSKNIQHYHEHCVNAGNDVLEELFNNLTEMKINLTEETVSEKINYVINKWNLYLDNFHLKNLLRKSFKISA